MRATEKSGTRPVDKLRLWSSFLQLPVTRLPGLTPTQPSDRRLLSLLPQTLSAVRLSLNAALISLSSLSGLLYPQKHVDLSFLTPVKQLHMTKCFPSKETTDLPKTVRLALCLQPSNKKKNPDFYQTGLNVD